jgi:hypothetical protein
MAENQRLYRVSAILGFVAAALALSSVVVRYMRTNDVDWRIAAAGLFIGAIALNAWTKAGTDASTR